MLRIVAVIVALSFSLSIALPTCRLSIWLNPICLSAANVKYSSLTYNGNCTVLTEDPSASAYRLLIDTENAEIRNFSVYNSKSCAMGDLSYFISTPSSLGHCIPLSFVVTPGKNITIGSLGMFCED